MFEGEPSPICNLPPQRSSSWSPALVIDDLALMSVLSPLRVIGEEIGVAKERADGLIDIIYKLQQQIDEQAKAAQVADQIQTTLAEQRLAERELHAAQLRVVDSQGNLAAELTEREALLSEVMQTCKFQENMLQMAAETNDHMTALLAVCAADRQQSDQLLTAALLAGCAATTESDQLLTAALVAVCAANEELATMQASHEAERDHLATLLASSDVRVRVERSANEYAHEELADMQRFHEGRQYTLLATMQASHEARMEHEQAAHVAALADAREQASIDAGELHHALCNAMDELAALQAEHAANRGQATTEVVDAHEQLRSLCLELDQLQEQNKQLRHKCAQMQQQRPQSHVRSANRTTAATCQQVISNLKGLSKKDRSHDYS